jgi:endonuclease YncB( thermonuclease family)
MPSEKQGRDASLQLWATCGVLTKGGKDVAAVLISDGLAHPYSLEP